MSSFEFGQRQRVRGVAGVDAVWLRRQGELGAQDPSAHAREAVRPGWTQGCSSHSVWGLGVVNSVRAQSN